MTAGYGSLTRAGAGATGKHVAADSHSRLHDSELTCAFEIGFLLFPPSLIIDVVVVSVLMSMGMMMLSPVVVSLPFRPIFLVLVVCCTLLARTLVQSYGPS